jgi:integrase
MFDDPVARDYGYGRFDLRQGPPPDNPWLAWALHLAHTMAETRGFDGRVRRALNRNLVMLLADHADGEKVRASDFHEVLIRRGTSLAHTIEILDTMGILDDDRPTTFDQWLETKLTDIAPGLRQETERWARALRDGGPRTRARDEATVRTYLSAARPALLDWSNRYGHLRETTRDDVREHVSGLRGHVRQTTATALRSLFGWAKRNGLVFRNPTAGLAVGKLEPAVFQPLRAEEIARTVEAADTPHARLFVALAAIHAARPGEIRALQLDDVDLANRRLTIAGRPRPLDDLTYRVLVDWLKHRRERWPHTANQHLVVSYCTALGLGPVSQTFLAPALRGLPATIERLRIDRQLEEALTHRADPLHLASVFGISDAAAIRYAASARQLLARPHETDPAASPRTQAPTCDTEPEGHSGSH